jgi:hypothetical protein
VSPAQGSCLRRKSEQFVLRYKRLEKGTFSWPTARVEGRLEIRTSDLLLLLSGGDITRPRRSRWYDRISEKVEEGLAEMPCGAEIVTAQ